MRRSKGRVRWLIVAMVAVFAAVAWPSGASGYQGNFLHKAPICSAIDVQQKSIMMRRQGHWNQYGLTSADDAEVPVTAPGGVCGHSPVEPDSIDDVIIDSYQVLAWSDPSIYLACEIVSRAVGRNDSNYAIKTVSDCTRQGYSIGRVTETKSVGTGASPYNDFLANFDAEYTG